MTAKTACDELRSGTRALHRRAAATAFSKRLLDGSVSRAEYVTYLRALAIVHGVLEHTAATSGIPVVRAVWRDEMRKLALIEQDLASLSPASLADEPTPLARAEDVVHAIRVHSLRSPASLVGYLYVLEGATNGGPIIQPAVADGLGLTALEGTRYLAGYGDEQGPRWVAFRRRIDEALVDPAHRRAAVAGARELFASIIAIQDAIGSRQPPRRTHAAAINPEAGTYPVPRDERMVRIALAAADEVLDAMPYIRARYGTRGARFTRSDGAWLATLAGLPRERVFKQVAWIGRFLSALGLPRYALAVHLRATADALAREIPAGDGRYDAMYAAADGIEADIDAAIQSERRERALRAFDAALSAEERAAHPDLARILVSAHADESRDAGGALETTRTWIRERALYSPRVVSACEALFEVLGSRAT